MIFLKIIQVLHTYRSKIESRMVKKNTYINEKIVLKLLVLLTKKNMKY